MEKQATYRYKPRLIGLWYSLIIVILVALLYEHAAKFDVTSALFWLRLILLIVVLALSFYAFSGIMHSRKAVKKVENVLVKELRRKNEVIKDLKKEKELFMKSALKRSEENQRLRDALRKAK